LPFAYPLIVKELIKSKYSPLFIAGLVLVVICAWFSTGFHQADEHFQILEFCNYKLGYSAASDLAWEFQQKVRASLLPGIAYFIAKAMKGCGLYDPFILAFLLRLFTAVISWFITCKFCLLLLPKFKTPKAERLFILMCFFLWFIPYITVRFTPENISGIVLLYGIYSILSINEKTTNTHVRYILAGLLFGISFFIRAQMCFAIVGFVAWLMFVNKIKWKNLLLMATAITAAIGTNILIDYWFYGAWTLTPFNYYYANIVKHIAADFGTNPWWFYFTDFIIKVVPPLSVLLLIMFFIGLYKNVRDPFVWIFIPFFILHCFIGHKEIRFLFPVTFIFLYITSLGFDYFIAKNYYPKIYKYVYVLSLIVSIPLLLYRTFTPANISVSYFKYLYYSVPSNNTTLFFLHDTRDYSMYGLRQSFYRDPKLKAIAVDSMSQIDRYLQANQPESVYLLNKSTLDSAEKIKGYTIEMVYCFFPSWIAKLDFNKWEERSQIWSIYRFTKIK
jgi:GPI mannosyltransferase 3